MPAAFSPPFASLLRSIFHDIREYLPGDVQTAVSTSPILQTDQEIVDEKPLMEIGWEYLCTKEFIQLC